MTKTHMHKGDIPPDLDLGDEIALDCEMMGLRILHDRLCVVQLRGRNTDIHVVQIENGQTKAPNLKKLLEGKNTLCIAQYARVELAWLKYWLGIDLNAVFCTKIASKLTRTYTERHGLKNITKDLLDIDISKYYQLSDWGSETLSPEQIEYAASDVLHLHDLKDNFVDLLNREGRIEWAQACFDFLPTRAQLDINGWEESDIFSHS